MNCDSKQLSVLVHVIRLDSSPQQLNDSRVDISSSFRRTLHCVLIWFTFHSRLTRQSRFLCVSRRGRVKLTAIRLPYQRHTDKAFLQWFLVQLPPIANVTCECCSWMLLAHVRSKCYSVTRPLPSPTRAQHAIRQTIKTSLSVLSIS